jgi:hypothetical protein
MILNERRNQLDIFGCLQESLNLESNQTKKDLLQEWNAILLIYSDL